VVVLGGIAAFEGGVAAFAVIILVWVETLSWGEAASGRWKRLVEAMV
jgi:hypothetical protein